MREKNILLAGASGFLGQTLLHELLEGGYQVTVLQRGPNSSHKRDPHVAYLAWEPSRGWIENRDFSQFQAVICLSGENIASKSWSEKRKNDILQSRVQTAGLLAECIRSSEKPPASFLCASATGFYGFGQDNGKLQLTESEGPGRGFLADVCQAWEEASRLAQTSHTRVVHLRFAMILHPSGGALQKMLPAFRLGLGCVLGSGEQWMSWISREDAISALLFCLEHKSIEGPVNLVSPHPYQNLDFSRVLAQSLHRPCFLKVPAFFLRFIFGEMANEILLGSSRVFPEKLLHSGFSFQHAKLEQALQAFFPKKA